MNEKEFPAFKNKNLRLAIAQSINKQGFVDSVKTTVLHLLILLLLKALQNPQTIKILQVL